MNKLIHRLLLLVALSLLAGPVAAQSTLTPANGWWWTKQVPDSGTRYALQFSPDLSSLYGVAATFRDDGSPVWYVINANNAADAETDSGNAAPPSGATSAGAAGSSATKASGTGFAGWTFSGSASEYAGGGGLADGPESDSSGLQAIVADVDLSFPAAGPATLTWTPRDGSPAVVRTLTRFPIGSTVQAPPTYAPAAGFYLPAQGAGVSYFMEMQGSADGTPHAYVGAFSYDISGRATWSVSDTLGMRLVTPFPSTAAQKGWKLSTRLLSFSGGSPITAAAKQPKQTPSYPIVAQLMPSNGQGNAPATSSATSAASAEASSMLQVANTKPFTLASRFQANAFPTAYVLHFANHAKNFTPYVTLASPGTGSGFFWYMVKGKPTKLRGYTSVALSSLPGGSLNASSTNLGIGPLYISDNPLRQGISPNCSLWKPAPAPTPPAPSLTNTTDCNRNTRWQYVELAGNYDITYINVFSVPLALSQGKKNYGIMSPASILALEETLAGLGTAAAVYPPSWLKTKANFIRVVSPVAAPSPSDPLMKPYLPSISSYLTDAFKGGVASPPINISNLYDGTGQAQSTPTSVCPVPPKSHFPPPWPPNNQPAFQPQNYVTKKITYDKNILTITGTTTPVTKGRPAVGDFTITANLTLPAFAFALYQSVVTYSVDNRYCTPRATETNGANDVFSAVVRDVLVGFSSGFVDSKARAPNGLTNPPAKTYGTMTSKQWSNSAAALYAGVQPPASKHFNLWANAITRVLGNQVYSSQYTDFFRANGPLGTPQVTPVKNVPMQITIMDDRPEK